MTKYLLTIKGATYSAVDVLEALANGEPTVITVDRSSKFEDASFHSVDKGQIIGEVKIETDTQFDDQAEDILRNQFPGVDFLLEEVAE